MESDGMETDSIEIRGRTVDEAIHAALDRLGVTRDEVEIEVLSEGRSGVFGMGSQEARVRVTVIGEDYPFEDDDQQPPQLYKEPEDEEDQDEEDYQQPQLAEEDSELARETLERMLDLLDFPNV